MIAQKTTAISQVRKLCQDIENQINTSIVHLQEKSILVPSALDQPISKNYHEQIKNHFERSLQELKSKIVQNVSTRLPQVISKPKNIVGFEERISEQLEDAQEQRQEWRQKYKKMFSLYENNQLQNDKLKIQVVALSESYEAISVSFQELKFKYHELKQINENNTNQLLLEKINQINKQTSSKSNSLDSSRQQIRNENQVMTYEKEMFLEEIRQYEHSLGEFKNKMEELVKNQQTLERQNQALSHELNGAKERSDRLDRQIMDLLNNNQELKLEVLELKGVQASLQTKIQTLKSQLVSKQQEYKHLSQEKASLHEDLTQHKSQIVKLKGAVSEQRQKNHSLLQSQRLLKTKITQLNKENQALRNETQKMLSNIEETKKSLQKRNSDCLFRLQHELTQEKVRNNKTQQEHSKKSNEKMQEISKMHKEITSKLQKKIHLLEKDGKEKRDKIAQLKHEVQRLYESLQIQIQKEFKSGQKVKELSDSNQLLANTNKRLEQKLSVIEESKDGQEGTVNELKYQLRNKDRKLKKMSQLHSRLLKVVLPKIKQELHNTKITCQHFSKMIQLEKEQTSFLLHSKAQHFSQLIAQLVMKRQLTSQQASMSHHSQLTKWKETAKNYEERYAKLKQNWEYLSEKHKHLQEERGQSYEQKDQRIKELEDRVESQHLQHISTLKTVDKLKEKCRQVQQYYRLVQGLERENTKLKDKINNMELYSFRADNFDTTKPRQRFVQEPLQKYRKTNQSAGTPNVRSQGRSLNDITTKAQFQKIRLEAVKREYELAHTYEY